MLQLTKAPITTEESTCDQILIALDYCNGQNSSQNEMNDHRKLSTDSSMSRNSRKSVHFGSVQIRQYDRVLGDNPGCSIGCPMSLGWNYTALDAISLDQFEDDRINRPRRQLNMTSNMRRNILHYQLGYSHQEIDAVEEEIKTIKSQREKSKKSTNSGKDFVRAAFIAFGIGFLLSISAVTLLTESIVKGTGCNSFLEFLQLCQEWTRRKRHQLLGIRPKSRDLEDVKYTKGMTEKRSGNT